MHEHVGDQGRNGAVEVRRIKSLGGLELIKASYGERSFPRHMHDEYVLGIMTRGAEQLSCGNRTWTAAKNSLILINAREPHANCSVDDKGLTYRVCYVPVAMMASLLDDVLPLFPVPVVENSPAVGAFLALHRNVHDGNSAIENESYLVEAVVQLACHHSERALGSGDTTPAGKKVDLARDYLEEHFAENVPLGYLAALSGLTNFHFLRSFRRRVGLPPAEYQAHLRLRSAKALLRQGMPIASVAADVGFSDQSHLTRRFKAVVGLPPGAYVRGGTGERAAKAHA